jgi:hypothetical protein
VTCPKAVAPFAEMMALVFVLEALAKEGKDEKEEHLDRTGRDFCCRACDLKKRTSKKQRI